MAGAPKSIVLLLVACGCTGHIDQGDGWSPNPSIGSSASAIRSPAFTCTDAQKKLRGTAFGPMRRLSQHELQSTLTSLLGSTVMSNMTISARVGGLPSDQMVTAGDFADGMPVDQPRVLAEVAHQGATLALADATWRRTMLAACAEKSIADDACLANVIRQFGSRVYRRDLSDAEVADLSAWYHTVGGGEPGLGLLVRRFLQSPALSFHVEQGAGAADATGRTKLTGFEVASRLSYFLTDTMPDDLLLAAARSGALDSPDAVRTQARRLLATPEGHAKVRDLFRYYSHLADIADPAASVAASHHIDPKGLGAAMHDEAFDYFEALFWADSNSTFADLLTSTKSFAKTDALSKVFSESPNSHVGLFHRPALLTESTERTSPIQRGAHLRKLFLCDNLGMPDPALVQARQTEVGDIEGLSNRAKTESLTGAAACTGCHSMINRPGFAFEGFDSMAMPRTVESTFNPDGSVLKTWPLDTAVQDVEFDFGFPTDYADSQAMVTDLSKGVKAAACFSQRVVEYYRTSTVDSQRDGCALAEAEVAAHTGSLQDIVIAAIANEDLSYKE